MDFIADFAALIPARVISEILGLPAADIPEFTRHIYSLARSLRSSFSRDDVPELQESAGWPTTCTSWWPTGGASPGMIF